MSDAPSWSDTIARAVVAAMPTFGGPMEVVLSDIHARRRAALGTTVTSIIEITGQPALAQSLERDPVVEAVFVNAVEAAIRTGLEAKRRLLIRAVAEAVGDEAKIDESYLLTAVLAELDVPHVRTLKALADEWAAAEQQHADGTPSWGTSDVWQATPAPIRAALVATGTAINPTIALIARPEPNRQQGISDYGLEVLRQLVAEGYSSERLEPEDA